MGGKFEIRNQNGAKRHRPSNFLPNKTVKFETRILIRRLFTDSRAPRAKPFGFLISNFEFSPSP
jgi:hypothetical protein